MEGLLSWPAETPLPLEAGNCTLPHPQVPQSFKPLKACFKGKGPLPHV